MTAATLASSQSGAVLQPPNSGESSCWAMANHNSQQDSTNCSTNMPAMLDSKRESTPSSGGVWKMSDDNSSESMKSRIKYEIYSKPTD